MNNKQASGTKASYAIFSFQKAIIKQFPQLLIAPLVGALLRIGLLVFIAHPIFHYYQKVINHSFSYSTGILIKAICLIMIYNCLKHIIEAICIGVSIAQISPIIQNNQPPLTFRQAINPVIKNIKSITSWIICITLGFNLIRLGREFLIKLQYFKSMIGRTDFTCTSLLILPCILFENKTSRSAYQRMGEAITEVWGEQPTINLSFFGIMLLFNIMSILPIALYFLLGIHQTIILGICIALSAIFGFTSTCSSKMNTSIILTSLYHFAKKRELPVTLEPITTIFKTEHTANTITPRHSNEAVLL